MLILLVVLTGVMAGIYLSFSAVIMKSLSELPPIQGAAAMNKINDVIVNTVFLPIFFGTILWFAGLIVWSFADWQEGRSSLMIAAAVLYVLGMFLITAFGNVPLNNRLKELEQDQMKLEHYWIAYLKTWTRLNHIRTLSCMVSCALLTLSLT